MKKQLILIALLLMSASLASLAQEIKKSQAQPDSIIKIIPFGEGSRQSEIYTIGGKMQTREDVTIRLLAYAPSAAEYHKAKNNITWGYISFGGFAASGIGAVIEFVHNNKRAGETTGIVNGTPTFIYQHHNLTGAYILTGVATGFLVSAIVNFTKASKHSKKALKLYNMRFE